MIKNVRCKGFFVLLVAIAIAAGVARAQETLSDKLPPGLNIDRLLAGPDHKDFKCNLELSPALLTFQQRFLVRLRGYLDPGAEDRRNRLKLFFVVKVADAKGDWLPGETYHDFDVHAGFDKDSALEYTTGFYVQPGKYTVALIVYDAQSDKTDVIRKPFEVKPLKSDSLPDLARNLAAVDFVSEAPADAPAVQTRTRDFGARRRGVFSNYHPEDAWAPGHGLAYLPVQNARPLRVDVILNLAAPVDRYQGEAPTESQYRSVAGSMLQAGAVLSDLGIERGCVRISAIDLSKVESVFEPRPARDIDWEKLANQIQKRNNETISVKVLSSPSSIADFLAAYLKKIADDRGGCRDETGPVDHAVVFVSQNFSFRTGKLEDVAEPAERSVRYLLVRINRSGGGDDLARFFKALQAQKYDASSPEQFRAVLAQLISDLGGSGKDRK